MTNQYPESASDTASLDRVLSALSTESNRRVVNYLHESPGTAASLDEVAEHVAASQSGVTPDSTERIAIRLHHGGLPKLADAGILEYDPQRKTIQWSDHPLVDAEEFGQFIR